MKRLFSSRRNRPAPEPPPEKEERAPARAPIWVPGLPVRSASLTLPASSLPGVVPGMVLTLSGVAYTVDTVTHHPDGTVDIQMTGTDTGYALPGGMAAMGTSWPSFLTTYTSTTTNVPHMIPGGSGGNSPSYVHPGAVKCRACSRYLLPGQAASMLCRQCATAEAEKLPASTPLVVVQQDDLIQATKYARLSLDKKGKPCFRGVGYGRDAYYTESEAKCAQYGKHPVPDVDCQCGFWVGTRNGSMLATWNAQQVALEVELAGTVLECAREGTKPDEPPWGYRAQWQRVLSVSLSPECGMRSATGGSFGMHRPCDGPPLFLCASSAGDGWDNLLAACSAHADLGRAIKKPVSFLRTFLQTEIRPGTISDDATPQPPAPEPDVEQLAIDWNAAIEAITAMLVPMSKQHLPPVPGKFGATIEHVIAGVTYTYKSDGTRWVLQNVDSPTLTDIRTRAEKVQAMYRRGLLSHAQVRPLTKYVQL